MIIRGLEKETMCWNLKRDKSNNAKPKRKKIRSLQWAVVRSILFSMILTIYSVYLVLGILFLFPLMESYKREFSNEAAVTLSVIDTNFLEEYFQEVKEFYYSLPEEYQHPPYDKGYEDYVKPLLTEEYHQVRQLLINVRNEVGLIDCFMTFYDKKSGKMVNVIDSDEGEEMLLPGQIDPGWGESYDNENLLNEVLDSNWFFPILSMDSKYLYLKPMIEIHDTKGNTIGYFAAYVEFSSFKKHIDSFVRFFMPFITVVVLITGVRIGFKVRKRIIRPLKQLAKAARKYTDFSQEEVRDFSVFKQIHFKNNDEIRELWETMVDMEDEIAVALKKVKEATAKQERIDAELDLAKSIQTAALPSADNTFADKTEFEIYADMFPAREVGGDFYDFFMIDDDHMAIVIADVSGKGVPAALFMMICKSVIANRTNQGGKPSEILKFANDSLCKDNNNEMFVTVWLGIMTVSTGEVIASNAGHEYPFITGEDNKFSLIKDPHGIVIGIMEDMEYVDYSFTIPKGGKLFLYTDGVREAQNKDDVLYGMDRIKNSLNQYSDLPVKDIISSIKKDVDEYAGEMEQFDDITMVCIKYDG